MGHSNTMKRRVVLAASAAAGTAILSYVGMILRRKVKRVKEAVLKDKQLDIALEDSMDCSDPVAKY